MSGGRGNLLVSFISLLAVTGLALGVALLVVVLSVMNGFDRELRERILSVVPHVQLIHSTGVIDWQDQQSVIAGLPQVTEVTPYNQVDGLIQGRQQTRPLQLLGLSAEAVPAGLQQILDEGHLAIPKANHLLLSAVIAEDLNVRLDQHVTIIIPAASRCRVLECRLPISLMHAILATKYSISCHSAMAFATGFKRMATCIRPFSCRAIWWSYLFL